ncbi:MAG: hypothetical protein IJY42_03335, partial [Clostridia bacterium]|nr:hypothetical protein [Clostridia bacterium]
MLKNTESIGYERTVTITPSFMLGRTLLHFGAVDSECEVFWNGVKVCEHQGGFTAFVADVSAWIREGENHIRVLCRDQAIQNGDAR